MTVALPPVASPPAVVAAPPTTPPAAAPVTATVVDGATAALAALAGGAPLSGTVAPSNVSGVVVLFTALGTVSLATDLPLSTGASMTLQAQASNPGSAVILAVNGSAPIASPTVPVVAPPAIPVAAPVQVALGTTIAATIVAPPQNPSVQPPAATPPPLPTPSLANAPLVPPVPATAAVPASVVATAPVAAVAPAQTEVDGKNAPPAPPALAGQAPTLAAPTLAALPPARPLPPGTSLAMRILAVQPAPSAAGALPAQIPAPALTGTIRQAATPDATPIVETQAGPLQLRGAPPLRAGTRVALRLLPDAPAAAELTILPETAQPTETPSGKPPIAAMPAEPSEAEAAPTVSAEPQLAAEQPGAMPTVALPTQLAAVPATAVPATPAEPVPAAVPAAPLPEAAPVRVILASPVQSTAVPGRPAEQILTGTVLPDQSNGRAPLLVETPLGVLSVSPRLAVPSGSLLLLAAPDAIALPLGADGRLAQPGKGWTSLAAALPALEHAAPALGAQLRAELTPQAGGDRLAATFLFMIDALRNPAGPLWPGELVAKALAAAGRDDDKSGLANDLGEARRIAAAPATGNWQVFLLPLVEGPLVRPLRLYLKRGGKSKRDAAEDSARFVLEFELSRLGALQLDGFVRPARFDLLLRTKAPLGAALESMVERIFHDRVAAAGIGGTIDFSTVPRFEIAPLDGMREHVGIAV